MKGPTPIVALIAVLAGCVLLAACGDSAPVPKAAGGPAKPAGPKLASAGEDMVAAVPAGKSARFVGVHFSLGSVPTVSQALPVDIVIIPHDSYAALGASFQSQEGLTLMSGDVLAPIKDAVAETTIKHQLSVMPARSGVFMITATVETEGADGTVTRVFSIPVIVGLPEAAAAAQAAPARPPNPPKPATN
jgi:hypothetical protein